MHNLLPRRDTLGAAGLCKRLGGLVSKAGQAMEKIFLNFSGFCFTTLKDGILLLLFYQTQQKLFLLILHPNGQPQKNLAPILEIGANRLEGIFCYLLLKKTGVH